MQAPDADQGTLQGGEILLLSEGAWRSDIFDRRSIKPASCCSVIAGSEPRVCAMDDTLTRIIPIKVSARFLNRGRIARLFPKIIEVKPVERM